MASVSSISRSGSLYGNRNVISGLASGLDTESMIENAVSGYKSKIAALQQKRTKTEWKQEAYRSMINKMSLFSGKYASYMSSNNLMSASFFNSAVKTVAKGAYADKISAVGKSSSDVQINRVKQLASAASYTVSGSKLDLGTTDFSQDTVTATGVGAMDLDGITTVNGFSGNMTLAYGGSNSTSYLSINFDESKTYADAQALADEINNQLKAQTINIGSNSYTGNELLQKVVKAEVDADGNITFADPKGNNVYISSASDSVKEKLLGGAELGSSAGKQVKALTINDESLKPKEMNTLDYLLEKGGSMEITLDGVTKTIKIPSKADIAANVDPDYKYADALKTKIENGSALTNDTSKRERDKAFMSALKEEVNKAFAGKLEVKDANGDEAGIQLQFSTKQKGSTIAVNSSYGKALGFGESKQATSYINTNKTLGELLSKDTWNELTPTEEKDADGQPLYSFVVNGKEIGKFNANSKFSDVMSAMNNSSDSTVKIGYSKMTNDLTFTAKDSGAGGEIKFEGLAAKLFGVEDASQENGFKAGQDAEFEVSINGSAPITMTRSSNNVDLDGMTVTLKGTFGYKEDGSVDTDAEAVTFETSADADKIVDVVKKMVEDYNAMVTEIKNAYSTLPAQQSNGKYYEPMTAEEESEYSESYVKSWTEKAKQGLLFGDRDLANLYSSLTDAVSMTGKFGATLRSAGITVSYVDGLSTLEFNEDEFRAALNKDPDAVRDAFVSSTDSGASSNGLMAALKEPLDMYGKTSGGKGILVEKAGSPLAASTMYNNIIQQELDNIDSQISRWQDKLSDKVDYYTNQFTRLEQLVQQMNSQSSYFSQMSGG